MFDITKDYVPQHNLAVDMVAACVHFYRKRQKPLRTIFLKPRYYGLFKHWVAEKFGEESAETKAFDFDGVRIEMGSRIQSQSISVDFWPVKREDLN